MASWKEVESGSAENTAIAAGVYEQILQSGQRVRDFNKLTVINRGNVDIRIIRDGQEISGKYDDLPAGTIMSIEPDEGIRFNQIVQKNIDAAAAEVAGKILFRWAKAVQVGV